MLIHLSRLVLRVNWEKSKLSPTQKISFLGMELDSVNLTARLSIEHAQSMLNCLKSFQPKRAVPLKHFQRLLGHMASTATVTWIASYETASALASRPGPEMGMATRHVPGLSYPVLPPHLQPVAGSCFSSGRNSPSASVQAFFLCVNTGWGEFCNGHAAAGLWTGPQLQWHINCLELLVVWLALRCFKTLLHKKLVLVRTDNTATVGYINLQGGLRSHCMSQLARHLPLWSQKHPRLLCAVHVPGELNRTADELSHQPALPGEWRLHPDVVQIIGRSFGDPLVDLLAFPDTSHCLHRCAGRQLASGPTQICVSVQPF